MKKKAKPLPYKHPKTNFIEHGRNRAHLVLQVKRTMSSKERSFSLVGGSLNHRPKGKGPIGFELKARPRLSLVHFLHFLHLLLAFSDREVISLAASGCFPSKPSFLTGLRTFNGFATRL